jgi:hypothetical protein
LNTFIQNFRGSLFVAAVGLLVAFLWGGAAGLLTAAILGILEVSLSFDNAVVNAKVLDKMSEGWRQAFLTVGMLIAVFGMRFLFPILTVAIAAGLPVAAVLTMAFSNPLEYARNLHEAHSSISAFGGTFLLMVFLKWAMDPDKDFHWIRPLEEKLAAIGKLDTIQAVIAGSVVLMMWKLAPAGQAVSILASGLAGLLAFLLIDSLGELFGDPGEAVGESTMRAGLMGFIYLEVLDASFSFDGVIGAFAITRDVVIITIGLAIGAMFVRSLTIYLVKEGTLSEYVFLDHGAHYGIGTLAVLMLASILTPIPEVVTGLLGVGFILAALWSSFQHQKQEALAST